MAEKYPLQMRIIHWLMALIVISLLFVGLVMADMSKDDALRPTLYDLHKSFGVIVFLLCLIRIFVRIRSTLPPLPEVISKKERVLAHLGHYSFYFFMLAMPASGYLMTNSFGRTVTFFGAPLPHIVGPDRDFGRLMSDFHSFAGITLIVVICLHVAGVIKHYLAERINLLNRMI